MTGRSAGRLYVYAFVDAKLPPLSLHGRTIETVAVGDLVVAASRTDRAPLLSEEALREQHDIVLELSGLTAAILPARFGSLVDRSELESIVGRRHRQLAGALALVRHREQMTVRLTGAVPAARRRPLERLRTAAGPGAKYLEARREAAGYPLPDAVGRLTAAVRQLIAADRAEPGRGAVRAVLYHLIERGTAPAYRRALASASSRMRVDLEVTGPWPPFAFAPELMG